MNDIIGWLLAKLLLIMCCGPWANERHSRNIGAYLRKKIPWRLGTSASRFMAESQVNQERIFWFLFAWGVSGGGVSFYLLDHLAWSALMLLTGFIPGFWMLYYERKDEVNRSRGALWLGLVSSSELCQSLGRWPATAKFGRHAGFMELTQRLNVDESGMENPLAKKCRHRLRAMALACAGSKLAAKWLWRRRRDQRSMAQWAREWSFSSTSEQSWELSSSMMSIAVPFQAGVGEQAITCHASAEALSEYSLPFMWAQAGVVGLWGWQKGFERELQEEALKVYVGDDALPWGWRSEPRVKFFEKFIVNSWFLHSKEWKNFLNAAVALLESEKIKDHLMSKESNLSDDIKILSSKKRQRL